MRFFSYITYLTAFMVTATHAAPIPAPAAVAVAQPLAEPNPRAQADALALPNPDAQAKALAHAFASAFAEAYASPGAEPLALEFNLDNAALGFQKLTTLLTTLKTLLGGGTLPALNIESIASLGVGLLNAVLEIFGEATGTTSTTDILQQFATDSVPALGQVATTGGYDEKLDPTLNAILAQYQQVLLEVINLNLDLIPDIQDENLIGAGFTLLRDGRALLAAFREANGN